MTKKDLEKMRDKKREKLWDDIEPSHGQPDTHEQCKGFDKGFNAAVEILWPRLAGLSDAHESIVQEPWSMSDDPTLRSSYIADQALIQHGVADE